MRAFTQRAWGSLNFAEAIQRKMLLKVREWSHDSDYVIGHLVTELGVSQGYPPLMTFRCCDSLKHG